MSKKREREHGLRRMGAYVKERPYILPVTGERIGAFSCFISASLCADGKPRWKIKGL